MIFAARIEHGVEPPLRIEGLFHATGQSHLGILGDHAGAPGPAQTLADIDHGV